MEDVGTPLFSAVGAVRGEMIAFVGAGGKTTAAWRLSDELVHAGERVVFTTTTQVFKPRRGSVNLILHPSPTVADLDSGFTRGPRVVLAAGLGERGDPGQAAREGPYPAEPVKLVGPAPAVLDCLGGRKARELPGVTWLVEADGARGRLLKAPADHEPVIPSRTDRVVVVAALDALGRPLDGSTVHRPEIAARLLGVEIGVPITPNIIADILSHPLGGMKGIPAEAESVVLLTQWGPVVSEAEPEADSAAGETITDRLLGTGRIARVVQADLCKANPVTRIWVR